MRSLRMQFHMKIRNYDRRVPVIFLLLALLSYSSVLDSFFLSDDFAQIGKVLQGDFSVTWGLGQGGFFRPLFICRDGARQPTSQNLSWLI